MSRKSTKADGHGRQATKTPEPGGSLSKSSIAEKRKTASSKSSAAKSKKKVAGKGKEEGARGGNDFPDLPQTVSPTELNLLIALKHPDPHRILGAHLTDAGVVVRTFQPEAGQVECVVGRKRPQEMVRTHEAGVFELTLPGIKEIPTYRLKLRTKARDVIKIIDPYFFLPTLGDLDSCISSGKDVTKRSTKSSVRT